MLSHDADTLTEGELTLPRRGASASSIAQAIASEKGEVVYEVLSRKQKESEILLKYRAMPAREWKRFKNLPRHRWPLVPQEIKSKEVSRLSDRVEFLLLGILGISLILAIAWQGLEISRLQSYTQRLSSMNFAATSAPASISHPQESWVSQLNQLTERLSAVHASLSRFEFSRGRTLVTIESQPQDFDRVRLLLRDFLGRDPVYLTGGHWQW